MKKMTIDTQFAKYEDCYLTVARYADETLGLQIWNEEDGPIAGLTKWIEVRGDARLARHGKDAAFIDTNNFPEAVAIIRQHALGEITGIVGRSGFCQYPFVVFDMTEVAKYAES